MKKINASDNDISMKKKKIDASVNDISTELNFLGA